MRVKRIGSALVLVAVAALTYALLHLDNDATAPVYPDPEVAAMWTECAAKEPFTEGSAAPQQTLGCFVREFKQYGGTWPVSEILANLHALAVSDMSFAPSCHDVKHQVAESIFTPERLGEMITPDDYKCAPGAFGHGAIAAFAVAASLEELWEKLPSICEPLSPGNEREGCAHGLGHAIAIKIRGTVFDAEPYCIRLPDTYLSGCLDAIFMSYADGMASLNVAANIPLEALSIEQILTMCSRFDPRSAQRCWSSLWQFYPRSTPLVELTTAIKDACSLAPSKEFASRCYAGLGTAMVFRAPQPSRTEESFSSGIPVCTDLDTSSSAACIKALAYAATNQWLASNGSLDSIPDLCASLRPEYDAPCREGSRSTKTP